MKRNGTNFMCNRVIAILIMLGMCEPLRAQEALQDTAEEAFITWNKAKSTYLEEVTKARADVIEALAKLEQSAREDGDFRAVKTLVQAQAEFEEKEIISNLSDRSAYETLIKKIQEEFQNESKEILTRVLRLREDRLAEYMSNEQEFLIERKKLIAFSRWHAAEITYENEISAAREKTLEKIDSLEKQSRERGDSNLEMTCKRSRDEILANRLPTDPIIRKTLELQSDRAKKKLEATNKNIIKNLTESGSEQIVALFQTKLSEALDPGLKKNPLDLITKVSKDPGQMQEAANDTRKIWKLVTYQAHIKWRKGDEWEEFDDASGALKWHYREMDRNDKYIELLLIERNHPIRLYSDHADIFLEGNWGFVATGEWLK